jgi:wobble nucleotide-excising tRNase
MIKKLVAIRNVGRFRSSAAAGNPELARYTLIVGANGYGKTTLCAVLRSLKAGDPAPVAGRRTLGVDQPSTMELLLAGGAVRFDGEAWSAAYPHLAIFDGEFVAENVHSGEVVEIDQRRNLYRIIIGEQGVQLAAEDTRLATESRALTGAVTNAARAIAPHLASSISLEQFIALPVDPHIAAKIDEQERSMEALREALTIRERPALRVFELPLLPHGFTNLLARTIDDIARDAEQLLTEHRAAHGMTQAGTAWLAQGLSYADADTCPFCGQEARDLQLVAAYRTIFGAQYRALQDEIGAMRARITEQFGEGAIGRLAVIAEQNNAAMEFWRRYCDLEAGPLGIPDDTVAVIRQLGVCALDLLARKAATSLETIGADEPLTNAFNEYQAVQVRMRAVVAAIEVANERIANKKRETAGADWRVADAELRRRRAIQVRHSAEVSALCSDHARVTAEKQKIDALRVDVRARLDQHTADVIRPYEQRINGYLDTFNAGFRIAQIRHSYPGGAAASIYQLVINDIAVDIGDARTPAVRPSFKNTLSAGDRSTLALAFFLAHLEADPNLAQKTVVFDDPFSSQDAFRRRQSVHEIARIARRCAQVIVLSHDATFLKQVWDKAPADERVALAIADHRAQGSKIMPVDLEAACQGRTATDMDDLQTYLSSGAGRPLDLIRKMRVVLETHCWTTYPACFVAGNDWLGEIVRKIREGGDAHPARDLYDRLDRINDYVRQYYHGEDMADVVPDQIDPVELTGYVKQTLRLVNALQA